MWGVAHFCPVDSCEQRLLIERRLGSVRSGKYFSLVSRYLSLKISKSEFDRCCIATIGRENVKLHNQFLMSLLKKICLAETTLSRKRKGNIQGSLNVKLPNGGNNLQPLCRDVPQSPRKVRTPNLREHRFKDRPHPLIRHGQNDNSFVFEESDPKIQEQRSLIELHSLGSTLPLSVEGVEEVDPVIQNVSCYRSPIRTPLGIPTYNKRARTTLCQGLESGIATDTCKSFGQLPDTCSLTKCLEQKLEMEGLKISEDATSLLNKALDVYLKRLIKPCLDLAASKSVNKSGGLIQTSLNGIQMDCCVKKQIGLVSASLSDFRTALEMNPVILGEDWPLYLEKICLYTS